MSSECGGFNGVGSRSVEMINLTGKVILQVSVQSGNGDDESISATLKREERRHTREWR